MYKLFEFDGACLEVIERSSRSQLLPWNRIAIDTSYRNICTGCTKQYAINFKSHSMCRYVDFLTRIYIESKIKELEAKEKNLQKKLEDQRKKFNLAE
ncbi:hypothetical protein [Bacillus cereus]|uniref:hypothetical protein n=1 Tax=Bacillus cereus TaxID=1396 RepID=UPI00178C51CF|nr:hypothetical protein [Bacillus cereus]